MQPKQEVLSWPTTDADEHSSVDESSYGEVDRTQGELETILDADLPSMTHKTE